MARHSASRLDMEINSQRGSELPLDANSLRSLTLSRLAVPKLVDPDRGQLD